MNRYGEMSTAERLSSTRVLTESQASVIKQTYMLLGLSVLAAMAGGYIGATSEVVARFFSGWVGWILAIVALNVIPMVAIAARHNPVLGVSALVADGFFA